MPRAKIYDETYRFEVFTEAGERWVECSCEGSTCCSVRNFKTREELTKIIAEYIAWMDVHAAVEDICF